MTPISVFSIVLGESKKVVKVIKIITIEKDYKNQSKVTSFPWKNIEKYITNGWNNNGCSKHRRSPFNNKRVDGLWRRLIRATFIVSSNNTRVCTQ